MIPLSALASTAVIISKSELTTISSASTLSPVPSTLPLEPKVTFSLSLFALKTTLLDMLAVLASSRPSTEISLLVLIPTKSSFAEIFSSSSPDKFIPSPGVTPRLIIASSEASIMTLAVPESKLPKRSISLASRLIFSLFVEITLAAARLKSPEPLASLSALIVTVPRDELTLSLIVISSAALKTKAPEASIPPVVASKLMLPAEVTVLAPESIILSELSAALSLSASRIKSPVSVLTSTLKLMPSSAFTVRELNVDSAVSKVT